MLIPWEVMTSQRGVGNKIYWKLTNIALVIQTIHERIIKEERFHMQIHYLGHLL